MENLGLTQRALALQLAVDYTLICRWLSGERKPAKGVLMRVHKKTGIPLEAML
jgi:transcriptional regulator with XRE-family HTH domain